LKFKKKKKKHDWGNFFWNRFSIMDSFFFYSLSCAPKVLDFTLSWLQKCKVYIWVFLLWFERSVQFLWKILNIISYLMTWFSFTKMEKIWVTWKEQYFRRSRNSTGPKEWIQKFYFHNKVFRVLLLRWGLWLYFEKIDLLDWFCCGPYSKSCFVHPVVVLLYFFYKKVYWKFSVCVQFSNW